MSTIVLWNTYLMPTLYLPAIFNDDYTGISDDDDTALRLFLQKLPYYGSWEVNQGEQPYFSHINCVGLKATEVQKITYYIPKKPSWEQEQAWIKSFCSDLKFHLGYKFEMEYFGYISKEHQCHKRSITTKVYALYYLYYFLANYQNACLSKQGQGYLESLIKGLHHTKQCALYGFSLMLDFREVISKVANNHSCYGTFPRIEYLKNKVLGKEQNHYLNY